MSQAVFWFYRLMADGLRLLPLTGVYRLGWALGSVGYYLAGPYRRLVLRNLKIAFGQEKTPAEIRALAKRHFAMLGANLFASIKLPTLSRAEIEEVVAVEGLETLVAGAAAKKGFVMIASHLGNWEMFAQLSPILFPCKVGTIYQALGNSYIDAELRADRARLGLALFERKDGFTAASKFLREGGAVGVLVDQHAGDGGLWCPFFGRLASTSTLAATLALRTGAWLVPAAIYTDGVAHWRCVIGPQIKAQRQDAAKMTARINQVLEEQIRRNPEDWFWVHNRWKLPSPKFLLATYKRGILVPPGARSKKQILQPFRILIRSTNWLGDAIMSIPAIRAIKHGRPDGHVTIFTPAKLADLWAHVPEVDDILVIEPGESVFAVATKIRQKYEVAILFPNSFRAALEVWLARIPRRVAYPGHRRAWLLNQVWREKKQKKDVPPEPPRHQIYHYLELAHFIGADPGKNGVSHSWPSARLPAPAATRGRTARRTIPTVGLCPGAEYGPAKRWLPERYADVIREVTTQRDCEWVLFGTERDADLGREIAGEFMGRCRNLIGKTTLAQLIEELRGCDLLLTNDTGTMHLADFLGVPTVAIFGSTEPALTGPRGRDHRILRHHVACSPCFLPTCPLDFRCMKAISVAEVVAAVLEVLDREAHPPTVC